MKIALTYLLILVSVTLIRCQNLIINGGFEADSSTQWGFTKKTGWYQLYSADIFHLNQPGPFASIDQKLPRSGKGFAGLYIGGYGSTPDSIVAHEYLIGKLNQPMIPGQEYNLSFWAKPSGTIFDPEFMYTCGAISASFIGDTSNVVLDMFPNTEILLDRHITNDGGPLRDIYNYVEISGCYKAKGDEKYIVIGNLAPERDNRIEPLSMNSMYKASYVIVDDVELLQVPEMDIIEDTMMCFGEEYVFEFDTSRFKQISVNGIPVDFDYTVSSSGTYSIEAYFKDCLINKKLKVEFEECDNCNIFIPNAISPNGDQINDNITVASNCKVAIIEAQIFDRWGGQVYYSESEFNWDGKHDSEELSNGVYVYVLKLKISTLKNVEYQTLSGDITITR